MSNCHKLVLSSVWRCFSVAHVPRLVSAHESPGSGFGFAENAPWRRLFGTDGASLLSHRVSSQLEGASPDSPKIVGLHGNRGRLVFLGKNKTFR